MTREYPDKRTARYILYQTAAGALQSRHRKTNSTAPSKPPAGKFLLAAQQRGSGSVGLFTNKACTGQPCAVLSHYRWQGWYRLLAGPSCVAADPLLAEGTAACAPNSRAPLMSLSFKT